MKRLVLDTNVAIAGLLWTNHSRRLLELATEDTVTLYSSPALLEELAQALQYQKFVHRMTALNTSPGVLHERYSALVTPVSPLQVPRVIEHAYVDIGKSGSQQVGEGNPKVGHEFLAFRVSV